MSVNDQFLADIPMHIDLHGEDQSWTPAGGGATTAFVGVFDNDYIDVSVVVQVASAKPALIAQTTAVAGIVRGDTVTVTSLLHGISAAAYKLEHKEDSPTDLGPGMSRLILKT